MHILKKIHLIAIGLIPCLVFAQYTDHRNRQVDSLEHVLATNPPSENALALHYSLLAWGYAQIDIDKTMDYAHKCIEVATPINSWFLVSRSYRLLGVGYYHLSKYDSAMYYYDKAYAAVEKMRDFPEKFNEQFIDDASSSIYGSIANLYNIQGMYHEAIEYYQKAMKLFEKQDTKQSQAVVYGNVGEMYLKMKNYTQAELNYQKLDSIAHLINDSLRIAKAANNFALLYLKTHACEKALHNAEISYRYYVAHQKEERIDRASLANILSEIYLDCYGNEIKAEEFAHEALALLEEQDIPLERATSLRLLAAIHLKRRHWRQAEQTALDALAVADSEPDNTLALYEILGKVYGRLGDIDKAWVYFDKHNALQSTWSNKNYQSAIREMEIKYETEKKEHVITRQQEVITRTAFQHRILVGGIAFAAVILALLGYMLWLRSRRNRALAERNDALLEMNATKDKFFSIISHDLQNPALAQRAAIEMMVNNACNWDANTLSSYYERLLQSADHQVTLLHNLLDWARLQTGRMSCNPVTFHLLDYLHDDLLVIQKMAENKQITFTVYIPADTILTADSRMIATVIRNLLTNAIKFTPAGGKVTISVTNNAKRMENEEVRIDREKQLITDTCPMSTHKTAHVVSVSDTGIGMNADQINELLYNTSPASLKTNKKIHVHSTKGTAGEHGSGLGLIVCRELLEKYGSELHVTSETGKGSRFWFEL